MIINMHLPPINHPTRLPHRLINLPLRPPQILDKTLHQPPLTARPPEHLKVPPQLIQACV